jgi:hypothetical protein
MTGSKRGRLRRWWVSWSPGQRSLIITALIGAVALVASATVTGLFGLVAASISKSSTPNTSAQPSAGAKDRPVTVEDVNVDPLVYAAYVYTKAITLNPVQLAQLSAKVVAEGGNIPPPRSGYTFGRSELITLTVAGNYVTPVTIENIQVVKNCQQPLARNATLFYAFYGGGQVGTLPMAFNLDAPNPVAQATDQSGSGPFFNKHVITLNLHEPNTIVISVYASKLFCNFYLKLLIATFQGSRTELVSYHGRPFSLTAVLFHANATNCVDFSRYAIGYAIVGGNFRQYGHWARVTHPANFRYLC